MAATLSEAQENVNRRDGSVYVEVVVVWVLRPYPGLPSEPDLAIAVYVGDPSAACVRC